VDRHFSAECDFLAALVQVPTDNPPGDCAPHAAAAAQWLRDLGLSVQAVDLPKSATDAVGMISAANLLVRHRFSENGP